ncbi:MAG TPA: thrombospondin type 3 repeat-containing protein, partial [Candidatus Sulfotelmatobacter sp.]|nr:thrombospondin type 3 repeat-containing protein [Candidatus Sulfotelmatobacter sp.]
GQNLSAIQGTIPTIRGPVSIQVTNSPSSYQMLVNIPGNVAATVMLATQGAATPVALVDGEVVSGTVSNSWLTLPSIGSGQHAIWFSPTASPDLATLYSNWAASSFGTNAGVPVLAAQEADPDGDGMSNYAEFVAGTDPADPGSRLVVTSLVSSGSASGMALSISGRSGRRYTLERSVSLRPAEWYPVVTSGILSTNQTVQFSDPEPPPTQAFYRVVVARP